MSLTVATCKFGLLESNRHSHHTSLEGKSKLKFCKVVCVEAFYFHSLPEKEHLELRSFTFSVISTILVI